jgi:hypothetical protein
MYLRRCTLTSIGRSSLFHDFLSAQREEDRVISKLSVDQLVAHHVVTQAPSVARTIKRKDPFCHNSNPTESDGSTASTLLSSAPSITDETAPSSFTQDLRSNDDDSICFSVKLDELPPVPEESCHSTTIEDFQLIKVLGKGATGKVVFIRICKSFEYLHVDISILGGAC